MSGATLATIATALHATALTNGSRAVAALTAALRAAAFWTAALLPLAYVPALLPVGPVVSAEPLLGLLAWHALCLLLGHGYARS